MNTGTYQTQTTFLRPITLPVEDILSPQEEAEAREARLDSVIVFEEESQAQADQQRQLLVAGVAYQSRQTQAEIYLAVALDKDVNLSNNNAIMLESLKRTQEQNNVVKAYAAYQEANEVVNPRF
ncbi:MAG: hypothetical protein COA44_11420 [Arcobacter sp.]|nr:MAG: hypothetical protein COA44_11420 [Arcobacter sp.]